MVKNAAFNAFILTAFELKAPLKESGSALHAAKSQGEKKQEVTIIHMYV
jgi:hypothetical protein